MAFVALPGLTQDSSGWIPHAYRWRASASGPATGSAAGGAFAYGVGPRTSTPSAWGTAGWFHNSVQKQPLAHMSAVAPDASAAAEGAAGVPEKGVAGAARSTKARGGGGRGRGGGGDRGSGAGRSKQLSASARALLRSKIALSKIREVPAQDWRGVLAALDDAEIAEARVRNPRGAASDKAGVSTFVYNMCISRLAKCFRWGEALDVLARMAALGVAPNR